MSSAIERAIREPFEWGRSDCVTWAADVVRDGTGTDPLGDWRGRFSTAEEASALLSERGHGRLYRSVRWQLERQGWREVRPEQAEDYALGLLRAPGAGLVLAVRKKGYFMVRLVDGIAHVLPQAIRVAWACPR